MEATLSFFTRLLSAASKVIYLAALNHQGMYFAIKKY
jgi:hypothetical protein